MPTRCSKLCKVRSESGERKAESADRREQIQIGLSGTESGAKNNSSSQIQFHFCRPLFGRSGLRALEPASQSRVRAPTGSELAKPSWPRKELAPACSQVLVREVERASSISAQRSLDSRRCLAPLTWFGCSCLSSSARLDVRANEPTQS